MARSLVLILLLAAGAVSVADGWMAARDLSAMSEEEGAISGRIDALQRAVAELGTIQAAYVAPGQNPVEWLERFPAVLREVSAGPAGISTALESSDAALALRQFADGTSELAQADDRARDNLLLGDALTASHILFGDGRRALSSMASALSRVRAAESSARSRARSARLARASTIIGATAAGWFAALVAFAFMPLRVSRSASDTATTAGAEAPISPPRDLDLTMSPPAPRQIDLQAVADICTHIARVDSTAALSELLDRAVTVLDASGLIVWLGAGDQLFAVTAHGYDASTVARLGPIPRSGDSAASRAWRLGAIQVVAPDTDSRAAVAAPMFGRDACSGVFALELREGREADEATRAVATMMAAQLASIMPGWPAASAPAGARSA